MFTLDDDRANLGAGGRRVRLKRMIDVSTLSRMAALSRRLIDRLAATLLTALLVVALRSCTSAATASTEFHACYVILSLIVSLLPTGMMILPLRILSATLHLVRIVERHTIVLQHFFVVAEIRKLHDAGLVGHGCHNSDVIQVVLPVSSETPIADLPLPVAVVEALEPFGIAAVNGPIIFARLIPVERIIVILIDRIGVLSSDGVLLRAMPAVRHIVRMPVPGVLVLNRVIVPITIYFPLVVAARLASLVARAVVRARVVAAGRAELPASMLARRVHPWRAFIAVVLLVIVIVRLLIALKTRRLALRGRCVAAVRRILSRVVARSLVPRVFRLR